MPLDNYGFVAAVGQSLLTRSAQPDEAGFDSLIKQGTVVAVKLCTNDEFSDDEENRLFFTGIVLNYPLPGLFRTGCVEQVVKIAKKINDNLEQGIHVHVHCTHGRDRTGLVCAAYNLIYNHSTLEYVNGQRALYGVDNPLIRWIDRADEETLKEIYRRVQLGVIDG